MNRFTDVGDLTASGATVALYDQNGLARTWRAPVEGSWIWWNVFLLDTANGGFKTVNNLTDEAPPGMSAN